MEVTILGTGSAYPSPSRGATSIAFRNDGCNWLVDCGEGTQTQVMRSNVKAARISRIFITHLHGDHVFGLPGLLCTISMNINLENNHPTIHLYGPRGLRQFVRTSLRLSRSELCYNFAIHELVPVTEQLDERSKECQADEAATTEKMHPNEEAGNDIEPDSQHVWNICSEGSLTVQASWLKHKVLCYGYVITECPLSGKLDVQALKAKGVQPGPLYAKIKSGESITTTDGEIIRPVDVLGPPQPGRKVVILGDTCDSHQIAALCQDADLLIHEATLEDELAESCIEKGHSTAGMAGRFAQQINARKLILTHFSQRYRPASDINKEADGSTEIEGVDKLLLQAKEAFGSDNVQAAEDFLVVTVPLRKIL
ncbi:Zinc phosphodiesterase ELAC protein 1 [Lamellibrachia satsuma]|nr:Zinc phosphodiesterase ELAC protein 1 [Lamellibrachia satsuma]